MSRSPNYLPPGPILEFRFPPGGAASSTHEERVTQTPAIICDASFHARQAAKGFLRAQAILTDANRA
jgi:hypothetical protein